MNLSEPFIRRPVATTLVMLSLFAFGVLAYRQLPVSDLPSVDFPTIQVSASLPGATPDTMAAAVATPLESQFSTIAGLNSMSSTSSIGSTQISLQFDLSRNIDAAAQDVQAAITAASGLLPPGMPTPPSFQKVNPAASPIVYIALSGPTLPIYRINDYGQRLLAQRISTVSGVAQVQVFGSQKYAVRVQLDPNALASRGVGIDEAMAAVQSANVNLPTGTLQGPHRAFTVQATGQLYDAAAYRPVIVAYRDGAPVRLEQLGRVIDSVQNDLTAAWYKDERAVVLAVQRQPGTNTVEVSQRIRKILPSFREQLPASVQLHVLYDRAESIRASVQDVKFTLVLTLALVVLVIFLFLRRAAATVIPSLALPMSVVGTLVVMWVLGYSLDNLSLMALTLSVGFVVDDAIVMLENVVRHMEAGEKPFAAALRGSKEIGFTIVSMTISLAAVFIPILFMPGIVGRLFREFAVTIGVAILVSGFVSLTLTPMLCSRFLRPVRRAPGRFSRALERGYDRMLRGYEHGLRFSLRRRALVMLVSLVVLAASYWLFERSPKGFLPAEDTGQIFTQTLAAQGISFDDMVRHQRAAAHVVGEDPNVEAFFSSVGASGALGASNSGVLFIRLRPRGERKPVDKVIAGLRPKLAEIPGLLAFPQNPPPIRIGGQLTRALYQFTLQSSDTQELYAAAQKLEGQIRALPGLQDVSSDLQIKNPQMDVRIDRDKASSLGVSALQVEDALYSAYGRRQVSTIYTPNDQYWVMLELLPEYQQDPDALKLLYVRSNTGALVPLSALAEFVPTFGPLSVNHVGQLPAVTLSFNLAPGVSLGPTVAEVERAAKAELPPGIITSFQGAAQAFQSSLSGLGLLLVIAVLFIYVVLGILYESFVHPLTILTALPFAAFGALVTLMVFGEELSVYAYVGIIMLIGLVKKNGIMMVDFALEEQKLGKPYMEAIYEACRIRFRPIMMTTMAALMGGLPLALGTGAGSESRRPLGLAVVGGLLFSQTLTLFVTPVFFTYMEAMREHGWRGLLRKETPPGG